ncbi:Hypothetical protein FKW44_021304, partial [Caligus rogercresseyi]
YKIESDGSSLLRNRRSLRPSMRTMNFLLKMNIATLINICFVPCTKKREAAS